MTGNDSNEKTEYSFHGIETVFYFVNPDGRILKNEALQRIASKFAIDLEVELYGVRTGPIVQDPKLLLKEINEEGIDNIEVICLIAPETSILLSYEDKRKFVKELESRTENTGVIAERIIDFDDLSEEPVFEEEG